MAINSDFVSKSRSMRRKQERRRNCFAVGTWNVRTLVESTGDERVCRKRPVSVIKPGNQCGDPDRKLNLVVRELRRYRVAVAGIQESKWFGSDVWPADGYTFLHSGRPLPSDQEK